MRMAQYAQSPVLLVGDIDRGGVYASFIGTYATLENWERELLKGFLVNKFRGDVEILRPGLAPLEKMCGVPVVGVVPYLTLDLDDEDSLDAYYLHHFVVNRLERLPGWDETQRAYFVEILSVGMGRDSDA